MGETELCFPQLFNTSCWKPKRPLSEAVLINSLLSFISLLTASLNLLVIISISHFKQLHTPTNLLLLSLAVSDFFVGLVMTFMIILTNGCWFLGDVMCVLYSGLTCLITSTSVGTLVLISVDRYVAICDPLRYTTKVTVTRVSVCISLCWSFSFLHNSFILRDNLIQPGMYNSCYGECIVIINYTVVVVDLFLTFIGPVSVIIVIYMRVFVVAVSQARAMRSQIKTFQDQEPQLESRFWRAFCQLLGEQVDGAEVVLQKLGAELISGIGFSCYQECLLTAQPGILPPLTTRLSRSPAFI
ncbi:trace amine-associated receptor 8a-like [Salarias fasciatus]|uniref:trace amine-associated receptor 8a-like n=1 Tax=Salarias fasciatus TaxID=181472 RepID=UPI0011766581|nr:trace amine-associated receptor 8a-like [Salarias fasciatus]